MLTAWCKDLMPSFLQGRSVAVTGATNATMGVALPLKSQGAAADLRYWIKATPNLQHSSLDYEPEYRKGLWQTQQGGEGPSLPRGFYLLEGKTTGNLAGLWRKELEGERSQGQDSSRGCEMQYRASSPLLSFPCQQEGRSSKDKQYQARVRECSPS